ncbi:uncharacterized protein LOC143285952 [Babylonia areolata]|uniref:uncharacterized protein LOC143285952 n=1 Tax=Babylonia areolata TaxID=304850 RepID=UPI003FD4CA17
MFTVLSLSGVQGAVGGGGGRSPHYLLPLGNSSVHREVMQGHDASLPDASQCFLFRPPYPGLPYDAITLGPRGSFVDLNLAGELDFRDLSLSFYVYPEGATTQGTLLSYRCPTGNVIRLSVMQGLFFVSFWDEYGVSVGMTAIPGMLLGSAWNHVVLIREIATGNIQIYHNGELVEDLDDDFPNGIRLPTTGVLRVGRGQGDDDQGFRGRYSCLQVFDAVLTRDDVRNLPANCLPESWNIQPQVAVQRQEVDGQDRLCVTDYVAPTDPVPLDEQIKAVNCDVLGLHCLTRSLAWRTVMQRHQWQDSGKAEAYYSMVARGRLPRVPEGDRHLLGKVSASDRRVCSRLCMRVQGCLAFAFNARSVFGVVCYMYDSVLEAKEVSEGTRYYALRAENKGGMTGLIQMAQSGDVSTPDPRQDRTHHSVRACGVMA